MIARDEPIRKRIILGDEYDDDLRRALLQLLRDMGATQIEHDWGVGGSQELETLKVRLQEKIIEIEAETYIGLSIIGEEAQVVEIALKLGISPEET